MVAERRTNQLFYHYIFYAVSKDGRGREFQAERASWAIDQVVARQGRDRDGIYLQSCKASDAAAGRHDADQNKCDWFFVSPDIFIFVLFHPAKNSSSIAKINQDFDSQILQNEWNKYRSSHLERHQQRSQSYTDLETEIHAQQMTFRENANIVHTKLNDIIDTNKARLADAEVEVGYEINRLYDKFGAGPTGTKGGECLDVRADLTRCYTTLKDSNECQIFVQKLDRCVTDALRN